MAFLVLLLALAERLGLFAEQQEGDRARYDEQSFVVVKIVDGDTIDLDVPDGEKPHTRVRLWGVDTPETKHPQKGIMYYGPEASAFTKEMTLGKKVKVTLEPNQKTRGKYGRLLAYIYLPDGKMLNEEIISRGYGYADPRFEHLLRRRFLDLQKETKREKRGLWEHVQPDQWPEWYRKQNEPK
jgi:micrococcal nuclease